MNLINATRQQLGLHTYLIAEEDPDDLFPDPEVARQRAADAAAGIAGVEPTTNDITLGNDTLYLSLDGDQVRVQYHATAAELMQTGEEFPTLYQGDDATEAASQIRLYADAHHLTIGR